MELLVATALGLWILVGVTQASLELIRLQRQWLSQARVQQDLRHMDELFRRELRRSGRWQNAEQSLWPPGAHLAEDNPWAALWISTDARTLLYSHEAPDGRGHHGWRQNARSSTIDLRLQGSTLAPSTDDQWQAVQDTRLWEATHTQFFVEEDGATVLDACPRQVCAESDDHCPPAWTRHLAGVTGRVTGTTPNAPALTWSASVRSRNVALVGRCPSGQ